MAHVKKTAQLVVTPETAAALYAPVEPRKGRRLYADEVERLDAPEEARAAILAALARGGVRAYLVPGGSLLRVDIVNAPSV